MGNMSWFFGLLKRFGVLSLVLSLMLSAVAAPFWCLTMLIDGFGYNGPEQADKENIMLLGALACSQGITTDGDSFIYSSRFGFLKTEMDGKTWLNFNMDAIPKELKENYNSAHIGGISCYDGIIYAALEDSKQWKYPLCALFDADTLQFTGTYFLLSPEHQISGCPWVAADGERGLFYSAQRDNSPVLICYDIDTGELVKTVELSEPVHKIQGGEVFGGYLYVATNDATQSVYRIDPVSGDTVKLFDRNLAKGSEGEGLTVIDNGGSPLLCAIDLGPLFINAFLRRYALSEVLPQ